MKTTRRATTTTSTTTSRAEMIDSDYERSPVVERLLADSQP
jgi:hypothetical protein